jgi:pimeloyl-ACP methyl ester carboxylesterase
MHRRALVAAFLLLLGAARVPAARAGTAPPSDPDINTADSFLTLDVTIQGQSTVGLPSALYIPQLGKSVTSLSIAPPAERFHVEAGYDAKGQVIINSLRLDAPSTTDVATSDFLAAEQVNRVKSVNGTLTRYNGYGTPLPNQTPDDVLAPNPMALLGSFTGMSVTDGIVVADPATLEGQMESVTPQMIRITNDISGGWVNGSVVRTFLQQNGAWVLAEADLSVSAGAGGGNGGPGAGAPVTSKQALIFSNVSWSLNATQDQNRRLARQSIPEPPSPRDLWTSSALAVAPHIALPPQSVLGGLEPSAVATASSGQNIVFQHGFVSSGATWFRMDPALSGTFRFGTKLLPSLNWIQHIGTQADDLINMMDATGQSDFLMVGHSNGGLVCRVTGQRRPDLVKGVITVGSPNNGLLLALNGRIALANALDSLLARLYSGCLSPAQDPGCYIAYVLSLVAVDVATSYGLDAAIPVAGDVTPGSSFLLTLNTTDEHFQSVGVVNIAVSRWVLMRFLGDLSCTPEGECGGPTWAAFTEAAYLGFRACEIAGILRGNPNVAYWCDYIADRMNDVDHFWNDLVADDLGSDAIVNGGGQTYIGTDRQFPIAAGDSHVAETKSTKVLAALTEVMDRNFQVPRQGTPNPAPAITSLSPAAATVGALPFTLTVAGSGLGTFSTIRIDGSDRVTHWNNQQRVLTTSVTAGDLSAPGTRTVQVANAGPGGGVSNGLPLSVTGSGGNPVPSVASIAPSTVAAGGPSFNLVVNGFAFVQGAAVQVDGSPRTTTFVSPTQLTATILPADIAAPAVRAIRVANPAPGGGPSTTSVPLNVTSGGQNPVPVLTSIAPAAVNAGGPDFTLTAVGSGFVGSSVVRIGGSDRATTYVSPTQLTAQILAADLAAAGAATIKVRNPTPGGGLSGGVTLTINPPPDNPVPAASSVSPAVVTAGGPAFQLTVFGSGFVPASAVKWNGSRRPTTYVSPSQVVAAIAAGDIAAAGSATVKVVNPAPGGGGSNTLSVAINPPPANPVPTLTILDPAATTAGGGDFTLTVYGSGFVGTSFVKWNGSQRSTVFVSPTQLTATIPAADMAAAGSATVKVTNPAPGGGSSNPLTFTISPPPANPVPVLSSLAPTGVTAGAAAFDLTLYGAGFVPGSFVRWNGSQRATTYVSATQLTAAIGAADLAAAGTATVRVINPSPGGGGSNILNFTIDPPPANPVPVATSLDPAAATAGGSDFQLNVYGTGFVSGSFVKWNGNRRATTYVSPTQVTAAIGAGDIAASGSATVKVVNPAPGGGPSNDLTFTINPPPPNPVPQVTALDPATVTAGGPDFQLTVTGSGFVSGSFVKVGGNHRPTTFLSPTQLTATVYAGDIATAGSSTVRVVSPAPGGGSSNALSLTIVPPPDNPVPVVSSISPPSVAAGGPDFQLTVNGSGFVNGAVVKVNGSGRPTIFVSDTMVIATVYATDIAIVGSATVKVRNPAPGGGVSTTSATLIIH